MARDRKRAKQRRDRRAVRAGARGRGSADATGAAGPSTPPVQPDDRGPDAADVPGPLEHASSQVDEFDAALVRGAGGVVATPETGLQDGVASTGAAPAEPQPAGDEQPAEQDASAGEELAVAAGGGRGGDRALDGLASDEGAGRERPAEARPRGASRAVAFLRASWAELQRVQWPDRRHVTQATAVVLGFVAVAGAYLGFADFVANEIVEFVLG